METRNEKIPSIKELEQEIGDFLSKKFGNQVKLAPPIVMPQEMHQDDARKQDKGPKIRFDYRPDDLIRYLDQYIVKQDDAKAILATKICTHFNRIKRAEDHPGTVSDIVGGIKNNVLMIGPTGVGKTYMIRLIAQKIGVPFVKGDATKFSETGYVGGDVEDLVRDLVREADDDVARAQYGIVYIDEIDKIASSRNFVGADVSRTGVQRALLKPMEETEIDMKVPHDPISMIQEIERFRKTGKRDKTTVNTRNILFIMSGAFADLPEIISKRLTDQGIGFGARLAKPGRSEALLKEVRSEDLIAFGFESEFVGRLPVRAVFEQLSESDLFEILKNPNNPIILGKKRDFQAYGIDIKFDDDALMHLARLAHRENTGARGLVSAIERVMLLFERHLPSLDITKFPATLTALVHARETLDDWQRRPESAEDRASDFETLYQEEKAYIRTYISDNRDSLAAKHHVSLSPVRIDSIADYYCKNALDVGKALQKIKFFYDEVKNIELFFYKNHDINIVLEEDAVDFIIQANVNAAVDFDEFKQMLNNNLAHGLKLVREKTGKNRFFITKLALVDPEAFISNLIKEEMRGIPHGGQLPQEK